MSRFETACGDAEDASCLLTMRSCRGVKETAHAVGSSFLVR